MDKTRKSPPLAPKHRPRKKVAASSPVVLPVSATSLPAAIEREAESSLEPRFTTLLSAEHPLLLCAVNAGYAAVGLALLLVARRVRRSAVCAHFVVDLLASGVTECYGEVFDLDGLTDYVEDMDARVPLESCDERCGSAILKIGVARGSANRITQPEALEQWARILPDDDLSGDEAEALVFGPAGRPLAIGEMIATFQEREARVALRERAEPVCVVRAPSRVEH